MSRPIQAKPLQQNAAVVLQRLTKWQIASSDFTISVGSCCRRASSMIFFSYGQKISGSAGSMELGVVRSLSPLLAKHATIGTARQSRRLTVA
jgi:hypothetical protein